MANIIKWTGGKERELTTIINELPPKIIDYYEPFVGGGSVFLKMSNVASHLYINDRSKNLYALYKAIKLRDNNVFKNMCIINDTWKKIYNDTISYQVELLSFYNTEDFNIIKSWALYPIFGHKDLYEKYFISCIKRKKSKTKELESTMKDKDAVFKNIQTSIFGAFYTYLRELYNKNILLDEENTAIFFFLRMYAFNGMFRYNKNGEFNVPYSGMSYNKKTMDKNIDFYSCQELQEIFSRTTLCNEDFETFLNLHIPKENDFLFLDPPYDTTFSTYDNNIFNEDDHRRLFNVINNLRCNWMLVIKTSPLIEDLYKNFNIIRYDKLYQVNFKNRNDRDVEHLLIKNY